MALNFEKQDNKFRVVTQGFSTAWLPDTLGNRKVVMVMLRYLVDDNGKALFTLQMLCGILASEQRQAASQHIENFRECGEDFLPWLTRQRKVDATVVAATLAVLRERPLATDLELVQEINRQLGRMDLCRANLLAALDQIGCQELRGMLKKQLEQGECHYREEYVIDRLFELVLADEAEQPKLAMRNAEMIAAVQAATTPRETPLPPKGVPNEAATIATATTLWRGKLDASQLAAIWDSPLGWQIWALVLYLQGVSTAAIGGWVGVHKSTICRWLDQVAMWASYCRNAKPVASSGQVGLDEKWVLIDGVFWYLFAAVDCLTGCPLHVALYPSNDGVHCKLFLLELKRLGYRPKIIITDGWNAYVQAILDVFPHAEHLYCRFHALHSLFRRLRKAYIFSTPVFKLVCKLLKSPYKRTAVRRLDKLKGLLAQLDASHVLSGISAKWPKLIKTVGSLRLPSTSNAVERFFGAFERLYRLKGPFCDEASAQKHLRLFMLGYWLSIGQQGQACPLEKAGVAVGAIPLYHLLNRPNVMALKERMAEQYRQQAA